VATRFYLPSSGAAAVNPAIDSSWGSDQRLTTAAIVLARSKTNTAKVDQTGSDNTNTEILAQFVSAPIGVINFNGTTVSFIVRGVRVGTGGPTGRVVIRLRHSDGSFTTLLAATSLDSNWPATTAETRILNAVALANVTSQSGDRIVVEVGDGIGTTNVATIRFGDVSATSDYALTNGLTTDLDPWIEFSAAISFVASATDSATASGATPTRSLVRARSVSDAATNADSVARSLVSARSVSDSGTHSDAPTRAIVGARSASDAATLSQAATRLAAFLRTISDSSTFADLSLIHI
jgi:hypothetical protein